MSQSLDQQLTKLGTVDSPSREITTAIGQIQGDAASLRQDLTRTSLSLGAKIDRAVGRQTFDLSGLTAGSTYTITSIGDEPLDGDNDIAYRIYGEGISNASGGGLGLRPNANSGSAYGGVIHRAFYDTSAPSQDVLGLASYWADSIPLCRFDFVPAGGGLVFQGIFQARRYSYLNSVGRTYGGTCDHRALNSGAVQMMHQDIAVYYNDGATPVNITSLVIVAKVGTWTGSITVERMRAL